MIWVTQTSEEDSKGSSTEAVCGGGYMALQSMCLCTWPGCGLEEERVCSVRTVVEGQVNSEGICCLCRKLKRLYDVNNRFCALNAVK